jgi:hypothetical protein
VEVDVDGEGFCGGYVDGAIGAGFEGEAVAGWDVQVVEGDFFVEAWMQLIWFKMKKSEEGS